VLSVTSGALAAKQYVITSSSQIKAGAVKLSDLAPAAHKALHGEKGAKGDIGPAGPQGLKGAAGPTTARPRSKTAREYESSSTTSTATRVNPFVVPLYPRLV
jgi:hypothetical protein